MSEKRKSWISSLKRLVAIAMSKIAGHSPTEGGPSSARVAPVKVLALGPPRTGANSIRDALEQLGYHRTYHFVSFANDRPQDTQTWLDAFNAMFEGKGTFEKEDFDSLFSGCQAAVGRPLCAFAPQLIKAYPDAKVILNTRDIEEWYNSWIRLAKAKRAQEKQEENHENNDPQKAPAKLLREKILTAFFQGDFLKNGKTAFKAHFKSICEMVPKDQLLIYDIKEGWEPLCRFLEKPIPSGQFPGLDSLERFDEQPATHVNGTPEKPKFDSTVTGIAPQLTTRIET
ncbi:hypothetical protein AJ79_02691 [Helicocarpus griseus UAMH5409]|uniref:PH domain-containing protein n=1 Tax=Helicocarpus griseus UAMH5409 TaxID=1447875 RepID=A0A2B7Y1U0_9EURO|nr:hypothetical protein AJ79_02691 [Helicocarpus griseus UAMH5409]